MAGGSPYERQEIDRVLRAGRRGPPPGGGLVLLPDTEPFLYVHQVAIMPALRANGMLDEAVKRFDSDAPLDTVYAEVMAAEVIVADVTERNADLMYVLGLCHGLGRCPLLLAQHPEDLRFDLASLRHIVYTKSEGGLRRLRKDLARAVRIFLAASRAKPPEDDDGAT